jgi:hypothetical protein
MKDALARRKQINAEIPKSVSKMLRKTLAKNFCQMSTSARQSENSGGSSFCERILRRLEKNSEAKCRPQFSNTEVICLPRWLGMNFTLVSLKLEKM